MSLVVVFPFRGLVARRPATACRLAARLRSATYSTATLGHRSRLRLRHQVVRISPVLLRATIAGAAASARRCRYWCRDDALVGKDEPSLRRVAEPAFQVPPAPTGTSRRDPAPDHRASYQSRRQGHDVQVPIPPSPDPTVPLTANPPKPRRRIPLAGAKSQSASLRPIGCRVPERAGSRGDDAHGHHHPLRRLGG